MKEEDADVQHVTAGMFYFSSDPQMFHPSNGSVVN